jgi:hypothetical protein
MLEFRQENNSQQQTYELPYSNYYLHPNRIQHEDDTGNELK